MLRLLGQLGLARKAGLSGVGQACVADNSPLPWPHAGHTKNLQSAGTVDTANT